MSGIDPDDPAQQDLIVGALYERCERADAIEVLGLLRDHIAAQPRVIELPEEDRTRKYLGSTMWRPGRPHGWVNDEGGVNDWVGMLTLDGPLTDAGAA